MIVMTTQLLLQLMRQLLFVQALLKTKETEGESRMKRINRVSMTAIATGIVLVALTFSAQVHAVVYAHYPFDTDYTDASGTGD